MRDTEGEMAIAKCKACKKTIPIKSHECPKCGEPSPITAEMKAQYKTDRLREAKTEKRLIIGFVVFAILGLFAAITGGIDKNGNFVNFEKNKEQLQDPVSQSFSSWNGSNHLLVKKVKLSMKNPDSFAHVKTTFTRVTDRIFKVAMTYRGTNSFGAVTTEWITAHVDSESGRIDVINSGEGHHPIHQ